MADILELDPRSLSKTAERILDEQLMHIATGLADDVAQLVRRYNAIVTFLFGGNESDPAAVFSALGDRGASLLEKLELYRSFVESIAPAQVSALLPIPEKIQRGGKEHEMTVQKDGARVVIATKEIAAAVADDELDVQAGIKSGKATEDDAL